MNLLGIFALMLTGLVVSQVPMSKPSRVAFTAGVNRSWSAPPPLVHVTDGGGSDPVVRMRAGAEVTMPVRQRFALQFSAAYSQTGEISSYLEHFLEGPLIENRWELDYLEFGVLGRLDLPYESEAQGLHLLAGPTVALPLACRTGRTTAQHLANCRSGAARFNVLLSGGAGVDLRLDERLDATVGFLYGLSLRGYRSGGDHLRVLSLRGGLVYRIP